MFAGRRAPRWSGQLQNNLLDRMRMSMKCRPLKLHSFLRRSFHGRAVAVARRTLRACDELHWSGALMLLMTRRAGAVLDDIGLVQRVPHVTRLTFLIDRLEGDAPLEPITYPGFEFFQCERTARHQRFV